MRSTEDRMAALDAYPERAPVRGLALMTAGFVAILVGLAVSVAWVLWLGGAAFLAGQVWQSISFNRWRTGYLAAMAEAAAALREDMESRIAPLLGADGS